MGDREPVTVDQWDECRKKQIVTVTQVWDAEKKITVTVMDWQRNDDSKNTKEMDAESKGWRSNL